MASKLTSQNMDDDAYRAGYDSFMQRIRPNNCPYLNVEGNSAQVLSWIEGWSDAFQDFFDSFLEGKPDELPEET